ncbi:MAG: polysaccharide biosynthesis tyrosine autokinase [Rhodocyclaceae bacterium]|nr:polysaccharide biosynthesis tyrosine autokinase [Pseudomonadota bacterium]MDQ7973478.1 polysaccharide biosynthesis tyrosine autokinase [Rhodocyclaceae bacterium]MDQ8000120.1 polysaccharide biosynthesis tyrosine autokinase [Pseudomonadota bacterium]MDQ8016456.1 polysaccharide biosynthesis tyrosine autokinase [Pseudomonadota bacterium]
MKSSTATPPSSSFGSGFQGGADGEEVELGHYIDVVVANRWLIAIVTLVVLACGVAYAYLTRPVYEANLLVQVEDSEASASKSFLGEASALFDVKTQASAEMEIMRSRMIVGSAVEATHLYIDAHPRYVPLIGGWLSRRATDLSNPGFLGFGGYTSGTERIDVSRFNVPPAFESSPFILTAQEGGRYSLSHKGLSQAMEGSVGQMLQTTLQPSGRKIELMVDRLDGKPGAQFVLTRAPTLATIEGLQGQLVLAERGRQSGVISATLQDTDPERLTRVLNAIGSQYVNQNIERKAAEAQKTLAFLDVQLPLYKKQLEQSEEIYNRYRNQKGTVAFDEEAKLILTNSVELQTKLLEAQQKRRELESRFTAAHPTVQTLDAQIAAYSRQIGEIQNRIKGLPAVQQDAVRMEREVRVNTGLYQSLLNQALQLRLVKEGKVGTVRLLDAAAQPEVPIKPNRRLIVLASLGAGLVAGLLLALLRSALVEQRLRDPHEVEENIHLPVFSSIPHSKVQTSIGQRRLTGATGVRLLAVEQPDEPAVESLRSLRTAMQFAMLESPNNRVMITGPTPGVGKSFVTANFAALMAAAGKKTLLIDADLRRGHLHQYLGLQRHGGLSELIAGSLTVQQTVHRDVVQSLDFLATGQLPPNPAELLTSASFHSVLERLSEQYDLVVIDTPPVLVASDATTIAAQAGTVLLVARASVSTMGELRESTRRLSLGGKVASGVLLNGMETKRRNFSTYKYGRYRYTNYNYESILPEEQ